MCPHLSPSTSPSFLQMFSSKVFFCHIQPLLVVRSTEAHGWSYSFKTHQWPFLGWMSKKLSRHSEFVPNAQKLGNVRGHQCRPESCFQWNLAFVLSTLKRQAQGELHHAVLWLELWLIHYLIYVFIMDEIEGIIVKAIMAMFQFLTYIYLSGCSGFLPPCRERKKICLYCVVTTTLLL